MKYYVIWEGREPGIYDNYDDALEQVEGYPSPKWKSFKTSEEAARAYREGWKKETVSLGQLLTGGKQGEVPPQGKVDFDRFPEIDRDAWVVDASCLGNPGKMEYRGVELSTGKEIFRVGPFEDATNNIGEFLAIVHALALMTQRGEVHTIYSDSVSGMAWVRRKAVKTQLKETERNRKVYDMLRRALTWLHTRNYTAKVLKWQTELWGEIPADFGRK